MPEPARLPVLEMMDDPDMFGPWFRGPSWDGWRAVLAAISLRDLTEEQHGFWFRVTGRRTTPREWVRELYLAIGRRGAKSIMAALLIVVLATRDFSGVLAPGERATAMVIAADRRQARVVFSYVKAFFDRIPMLRAMVAHETAESLTLTNGVTIEVHTASFRAVRGYTVIAAVLDEAAFFPTEDSANPDVEIVNAIRPAMATVPEPLLMVISSPYARRGVLWEAYRKHYGVEGDPVVVVQAPTRVMNPLVDERIIAEAYERDPAAAAAEFGAQFRTDVEAFVPREVVEALVVAGRAALPPVAGVRYVAFTDPSGGSQDSMTLAITHQERGRAVLDVVRERRAPFSPEDVVREFAGILKAYGIGRVMGDNYAKEWPIERFRVHGIAYEPAELTKSNYYAALLPLLMSQQAELLDDKVLVNQLCTLERRTSWAGRDSISHPPGGRDDVANAAAGALVLVAGRHRKMFEEWKDVRLPAEPKDLDDLLPRSWSCPRCGATYLVGPDVTTPRCARCNPGWTREQILYGGEALGLWT